VVDGRRVFGVGCPEDQVTDAQLVQRDFFDLYYNNDLSLAEIAENYKITRQAVRDALVRAEKTLTEFEEKLGLLKGLNHGV